MFFILGFLVLGLARLYAADPEAGAFFLQQYSPKIYSANPQNWAILQDRRGVMYFGNTEGVLEYDGATWRKIIINGGPAMSLATGKDGIVFVGSQNDLGFLEPDAQGSLHFTSLLKEIPVADRNFGFIWSVAANSAGIWFQSRRFVFHWTPEHKMAVLSGHSYGNLFAVDDSIYLDVRHEGLHRVTGTSQSLDLVQRVPGDATVKGMVKFHGRLVVATADSLYHLERTGLQSWETPAAQTLQAAGVLQLVSLHNGDLAVGTLRSGLLLLDSAGSLSRIVSKIQNLRSDFVNTLFEDRQGGVWLALDRGLARVDVQQSSTLFREQQGLPEMVTSVARQDGKLYAGTALDLSSLAPSAAGDAPHFEPISGIRQLITTLLSTPYGLLAGGAEGIWAVDGNHAIPLEPTHRFVYDLALSKQFPEVMFAAGREGLFVFRRQSKLWRQIAGVPANGDEFRTVVEDNDGRVWVSSRSSVLRIDWQRSPARVVRFGLSQGVPEGWINGYRIGNAIVFATARGLRKFDEVQQRLVPDDRFGKDFSDGTRPVSLIRQNVNGDVWISGAAYHGILSATGTNQYTWTLDPLAESDIKELYSLHFDPDATAFASGADGGLTRFKPSGAATRSSVPVLLRRIEGITSSRQLFGGETKDRELPKFRHADNALRFSFALPTFGDEGHTEYQVLLQGFDRKWSSWSTETQKEYTNLFEKTYTFRVRARAVGRPTSPETSYSFRLLPPWYRTWWAYLIDVAAFCAAAVYFVRWRLAHLAAQNRKLEQVIEERTVEIRQQRDEIQAQEAKTEKLLLNILPQAVAAELLSTGSVKPLLFNNVAVCFTDFVGFTASSEQMSAPDLVKKLDHYFTAFDKVVDRYGLEKLKTIGDAYMFVGGLPSPKPSYAVDTVLAALELVQVVEELRRSDPATGWQIRVGIHCGPAIAGIVGFRKFAFDIWGETVNRASRMESCSKADQVNISEETYRAVNHLIPCFARGPISTKEGRAFDMYFAQDPAGKDIKVFPEKYERLYGKKLPTRTAAVETSVSSS